MSQGDRSEQGRQHLERLGEAHQLARRAIMEVEARGEAPPTKAAFDANSVPERLQRAHATVIDYRDQVAIFEDAIPAELWDASICSVEIPEHNGEAPDQGADKFAEYNSFMERQHSQLRTDIDDTPPDTEDVAVTLSTLSEWRQLYRIYHKEVERAPGRQQYKTFRKRVVLPMQAVAQAFERLNKCLGELGIRTEVHGQRDRDAPPEAPSHVVDAAPGFNGPPEAGSNGVNPGESADKDTLPTQ